MKITPEHTRAFYAKQSLKASLLALLYTARGMEAQAMVNLVIAQDYCDMATSKPLDIMA